MRARSRLLPWPPPAGLMRPRLRQVGHAHPGPDPRLCLVRPVVVWRSLAQIGAHVEHDEQQPSTLLSDVLYDGWQGRMVLRRGEVHDPSHGGDLVAHVIASLIVSNQPRDSTSPRGICRCWSATIPSTFIGPIRY